MTLQVIASSLVALVGVGFLAAAITHERRMHAHRQPGVNYSQATFRRDGGWRRRDLFTDTGLFHQQRASLCGMTGAALLLASVFIWAMLGGR
jgi:hypothetical protein